MSPTHVLRSPAESNSRAATEGCTDIVQAAPLFLQAKYFCVQPHQEMPLDVKWLHEQMLLLVLLQSPQVTASGSSTLLALRKSRTPSDAGLTWQ